MFEDADEIIIPGFSGAELRAEDFPVKLPELRPRYSPTQNVTVHQYTHGSQHISLPNPLDIGHRVVDMATTASGWLTVIPPVFECMFTFACSRSAPPY